jgi:hypothetical protein
MMIGAIRNEFSEIFVPGNGADDQFKVVTVAAVPSGFLPHLTDQAGRNNDSELRRKFAPCLFPLYMFLAHRARTMRLTSYRLTAKDAHVQIGKKACVGLLSQPELSRCLLHVLRLPVCW